MSRLKFFTLFFALFLSFLIFIFSPILLTKGVELSLRNHFKKTFLTSLNEENLILNGSSLIFQKPTLLGLENELHLSSEELKVQYEFDFLKRELNLYLTFVDPHLDLNLMGESFYTLLKNKGIFSKFFTINCQIKVEKGTITYGQKEEKEELLFSLDSDFVSQNGVKFHLFPKNEEGKSVAFHLVKEDQEQLTLNYSFQDFSCKTIAKFLSSLSPSFDLIEIKAGVLEGDGKVILKESSKVKTGSSLFLKDLLFCYKPLDLVLDVPHALLEFSSKKKGKIELEQVCLFFAQQNGKDENEKNVDNPFFSNNHQLLGSCSLQIDLQNKDQLMTLDFKGEAEQLTNFLPETKKSYFEHAFKHDKIFLTGCLKKLIDADTLQEYFSFDGLFDILSKKTERKNEERESLSFGFDLEDFSELKKIKSDERKIKKFTFQNGWFKASKLNLKKYLAPFLFENKEIKLTGYGNFEGSFDKNKIEVCYFADQVVLENDHFRMETDRIIDAKHFFDLKEKKNYGLIPVKNGTYFEKLHGLTFTDINADFEVDSKIIRSSFIEAYCYGAYFSGSQELDLTSPMDGEFDLHFHLLNMKAKFLDIQNIFTHFKKPYFFLKMPLTADLFLRQEGAFISFHFEPDDFFAEATIQGEIANGVIESKAFDLSLQELSCHFDYDKKIDDLIFSDIQGALFVGKPEIAEEYLVAGDHVRFTDHSKNEAEFDLWVGDKNRDILRINGKTKAVEKDSSGNLISILLDKKLSHFGEMQLTSFNCLLHNWFEIEQLDVDLKFKLDSLLSDLQRFSRTGLFFLSTNLLEELGSLKKASGNFFLNFVYDKTNPYFNYEVWAKDFGIGSYLFETAFLKGKKSGSNISIDELKLDEFKLAADIFHEEDLCRVNFLGMQIGNCLTLALEGDYKRSENALFGEIKFCEFDVKKCSELPQLKEIVENYELSGKLKGKGDLTFKFGRLLKNSDKIVPFGFNSPFHIDLLLNASLMDCQIKNLILKDSEKISCHYVSDKGLVLRGIETALLDETRELASLNIDKVEYEIRNQGISVEGASFKIEAEKLRDLSEKLKKLSPGSFDEKIGSLLIDSKKNGILEGIFNFDLLNPHYALNLTLKDDYYHLFGEEHFLKNFRVDFDPCEFKLTSIFEKEKFPFSCPFSLMLQSKSPKFEYGKLLLSHKIIDDEQDPEEEKKTLAVYWRKNEAALSIETVEGSFNGVDFHLYRNQEEVANSHKFHLKGDCSFDGESLNNWLEETTLEKIKPFQIGGSYFFKGMFSLFNGKDFDIADSIFKGELTASAFALKGYLFDSFRGDVSYQKNEIDFENVKIEDACGSLFSSLIKLRKDEKSNWKIELPRLQIESFRPSCLKKINSDSNSLANLTRKPLFVKELVLENLEGYLLHLGSMTGCGHLSFKNPHKKNLQNTILAIPAEIISKIGLDLTVLTPVIGTIDYQILNEKILLTKFRDVYSEGKSSKFYLAETAVPSYVDFEGNLFLKIRMKHHNLLFKLAELFTLSVEGSIRKPKFTFHKQQKHEQEALMLPVSTSS